jgi:hypothetical protein
MSQTIAFMMVNRLRMQAVRATFFAFASGQQPGIERLDHRVEAGGDQRALYAVGATSAGGVTAFMVKKLRFNMGVGYFTLGENRRTRK